MTKDKRCCTDGGDWTARFVVLHQSFAKRLTGIEICCSGQSSGQEQEVGILEVDFCQRTVCYEAYAVSAVYNYFVGDTYGFNLQACTTHNIYWSQCFYVLEAGGQEYKNDPVPNPSPRGGRIYILHIHIL